ncbi:helix-turn-helix transcriptional regulator [Phycicoccus sp. MAQZ13P-2]|uniref:helix-turn-helix domain-containing protein n=1 Tax=Phycicoccus mangrovi TaxID=2840470 RepID=UPI001C0017C5|nr:helix-turn-helix transcriptional regulator [Phycicoccus mangrovi]MBT9255124.1 helix-turn-helix transcriptional regulator [Phycicoccus mangrovi]MBT9274108.1 helix-turn-helix transcriptional regulator [Phycicoccus mangrovi]
MADGAQTLPQLLKQARARRRISQLDLAIELGVSQRHLSFVEVGRSRPGRELLLRWLRALDAPLLVRNQALHAAGYAPAYDESAWDGAGLADARLAVARLLHSHEPWPALLLGPGWDVLAANAGVTWLFDAVGVAVDLPGPEGTGDEPVVNLLDLALGPLGAAVTNLPETAAALLGQLSHEAVAHPALRERVERVAEVAAQHDTRTTFPPVLVSRYASRYGELALLSMFTTFGTPHSVTLESLRVELMFPADEATRALLE